MSLPDAWVDRIFSRLTLVYGHDFLRRWEGLDMNAVKADWAQELSRYQQSPEAIKFALEHLDTSKPPTVLQFRETCGRAPQYVAPELPAPKPDPAVVAKAVEAVKRIGSGGGGKAWAYRLRDKEKAGGFVGSAAKVMWREALGQQREEVEA